MYVVLAPDPGLLNSRSWRDKFDMVMEFPIIAPNIFKFVCMLKQVFIIIMSSYYEPMSFGHCIAYTQ